MKRTFSPLLLLISWAVSSQPLHIYSIASVRQSSGDVGYTMDGGMMTNAIRPRLLHPPYYGPSSVFMKRTVIIHDTFATSNSLTGITRIDTGAVLFIGSFDRNNASTKPFTEAELDSVFIWTMRGGKVINTSGLTWSPIGYDCQLLNSRYGFEMSNGSSESLNGQPNDPAGSPFNGPFGAVGEVLEGGGMQGYYTKLPPSHKVFGTDKAGRPTLVMDCNTMDFLVADTDVFTTLNMAYYQVQYPLQLVEPDKLFGNMLDFITRMPPPPVITNNGTQLSLASTYQSYQWYRDAQAISGETGTQLNAKGDGTFYVEVPVRGGCKVRSNAIEFKDGSVIDNSKFCEVFVPSAFSPDGNGLNEKAHVYGGCIQEVRFRIFDRWGELVFETGNINDGWDGTFNGRKLTAGVFAWSLSGKFPDGSDLKKSGQVTLVR